MKKSLKSLLVCLAVVTFATQLHAQGKGGKLTKVENFESKYVKARNVEIWLPKQYFENEGQSFPVLYMHDGQNVFNKETSTYGTAWEADDIADRLIDEGKIKPVIIVASWSTDSRYSEYFPEKATQYSTEGDNSVMTKARAVMGSEEDLELKGDEYLKFLVNELKPYIDNTYRTLKDAKNTSICGSSMGGLISMYAICEYPNVFGQAACVSTHWPLLEDNENMKPSEGVRKYLSKNLPSPLNHRLYFDYGTRMLDQYYEVHQAKVDEIMKAKGYTKGKNWVTRKFEGAKHNEDAWQQRLDVILLFLYGK